MCVCVGGGGGVFVSICGLPTAENIRILDALAKLRKANVRFVMSLCLSVLLCRARSKRDGTRAETRFGLSAKRTSPFKSAGGFSSVGCWQPMRAHQR